MERREFVKQGGKGGFPGVDGDDDADVHHAVVARR
jgi:hypothetical protein